MASRAGGAHRPERLQSEAQQVAAALNRSTSPAPSPAPAARRSRASKAGQQPKRIAMASPTAAKGGATDNAAAGAGAGGSTPGAGAGGEAEMANSRVVGLNVAGGALTERGKAFVSNAVSTTKYNVITFVPRSLFEQFRRLANCYFLGISILMLIGTENTSIFSSPLSPYSTLGPLVLVLAITMVKEGLEDFKRFKADRDVNARTALVLDASGKDRKVRWDEIAVGSLVRIENHDEVPADVVVVFSSEARPGAAAVCYVETSNIDGETNLKIREAVTPVQEAVGSESQLLTALRGTVVCDKPNENIHAFNGTIDGWMEPPGGAGAGNGDARGGGGRVQAPLGARNVLLRGCSLRNTKFVYGIVVYTGAESKVMKKSGSARSKLSAVEKVVNRIIYLIFLTQFALCTIATLSLLEFEDINKGLLPYLEISTQSYEIPTWLAEWLTSVILYNNLIPISLYVTMEMANYCHAFFIDNDAAMYDAASNTPAAARTSNVAQDLGQIEYVFSDKTGTLTQNIMTFRRCSIGGQVLGRALPSTPRPNPAHGGATETPTPDTPGGRGSGDAEQKSGPSGAAAAATRRGEWLPGSPDPALAEMMRGGGAVGKAARDFMTLMAVCHTVVTEKNEKTGRVQYQAESPDEAALVQAAKDAGFEFVGRGATSINIRVPGDPRPQAFELLGVHEFTSARKRMSVVVRTPDGRVLLMTKGADNVMLERSVPVPEFPGQFETLTKHLSLFARDGLRTLVLAQRVLPESEYKSWQQAYTAAASAMTSREERLAAVAARIELNLQIVGATAIEDKLQDHVGSTLMDLRRAGIKTWVLTGDKVETAINIAYACRLINDRMHVITIDGETALAVRKQVARLGAVFKPMASDPRGFVALMKASLPNAITHAPSAMANEHDDEGGAHHVDKSQVGAVTVGSAREGQKTEITQGFAMRAFGAAPIEEIETDSLAIVVTGKALTFILGHAETETNFMWVGSLCKAVIACRVSPKQKGDVVDLVRHKTPFRTGRFRPMTLAIGDGANDVGMIQRAQVGVGISGKEGMQAVNASDFAIAQFSFLKRLLLVHGRWSYRRMCKVVLYSFYKNVVITLTLFYYSGFTGFSGASLYESLVYSGFNFFLGWPIFIIGCVDRDLPEDVVLSHPEVYVSGRKNLNLGVRKMLQWLLHAVVHSLIVFWVPLVMQVSSPVGAPDGMADGVYVFGTFAYACMIFTMHWKIFAETHTWTVLNWGFMAFSVFLFFFFLVVYSHMQSFSPEFYYVGFEVMAEPRFWLGIALCVCVAAVLDVPVEWFRQEQLGTPVDLAIKIDRRGKKWEDFSFFYKPPAPQREESVPVRLAGAKPSLRISSAAANARADARRDTSPLLAAAAAGSAAGAAAGSGSGAAGRSPRMSSAGGAAVGAAGAPDVRSGSVSSDSTGPPTPSTAFMRDTEAGTLHITGRTFERMLSGISNADKRAMGLASPAEGPSGQGGHRRGRSGFDYSGPRTNIGPGAGESSMQTLEELGRGRSSGSMPTRPGEAAASGQRPLRRSSGGDVVPGRV